MVTSRRRTFALFTYLGAFAIVVADQLAKSWIVAMLGDGQPPLVLVPGVLELIYRLNTGMAFSLLLDFPVLLTLVAAGAAVALVVVTWRLKQPWWAANLALALLLGGAVGNLIDRLRIGAVVDYVYVRLINFPAFNVADASLTIGVLVAAWAMMQSSDQSEAPLARGREASSPARDTERLPDTATEDV